MNPNNTETYLQREMRKAGTFSLQQDKLAHHIYGILKVILPDGKFHTKKELLTKLKDLGTTHDEGKVMEVVKKLIKIKIVGEYSDGDLQAVEYG